MEPSKGLRLAVVGALLAALLAWGVYVTVVRDASAIVASVLAVTACSADSVMHLDFHAIAPYEAEGFYPYSSVWYESETGQFTARFLAANASAVYVSRLHGCVLLPLSPAMEHARELYLQVTKDMEMGESDVSNTSTDKDKKEKKKKGEEGEDAAKLRAVLKKLWPGGPRLAHREEERDSNDGGDSSSSSSSAPTSYGDDNYFGDTSMCSGEEQLGTEEVAALQRVFDDEIKRGEGQQEHTRGLVAVHCGKLVAESYASWLNVTAQTPQLGWSMSKSVMSTLIGVAVGEGHVTLEDLLDLDMDESTEDDNIRLRHLLHMVDGLDYNEHYGMINDPARMLFLSRSTAGFARNKDPSHLPGERWCYNSGATNLASWMLRQSLPSWWDYWRFPYEKLFGPIGARSFMMATDSEGIFVGSSFGFATARDWARFGALHLQNGTWQGKQVVPHEHTGHASSHTGTVQPSLCDGMYNGGWWHPPRGEANITQLQQDPANACLVRYLRKWEWARHVLPQDTSTAAGYKGQFLIVAPSHRLVLVRLGNGWGDNARDRVLGAAVSLTSPHHTRDPGRSTSAHGS